MKDLGICLKDDVIGAEYKLQILESAQKLSKQLKDTYKSMKIDFKNFNTSYDGSDVEKNPPIEIYEYQNFFLLEKSDGKIVLLDGFRRLLWYDAPETPILVRTYKQSDLTSAQILALLINLNHFKFFSDSSYQERGFGLLLKTVFDIDITKFRDAFDAYLSSDKTKNSYSGYWDDKEGTEKIETIKERILDPHFVDDMKFLATLNDKKCMVNSFFGALLYQKRMSKKGVFSAEKFMELHKADKVLADLMEKFKKAGTNSSAKSQSAVNQIQEIYNNFFTLMEGGTIEKSYAEKVQECKELREQMNKDKAWTKLTGNSDIYKVERAMEKCLNDLKFKCIVMPEQDRTDSWSKTIPLQYGINELVKFIKKEKPQFKSEQLVFGFTDPATKASWIIRHNYGNYNSYGKKYTKASFVYDRKLAEKFELKHLFHEKDIELWVNIPKSEWKDL